MLKRLAILSFALLVAAAAFGQSTMAGAVNGMTFNGSTGLIVVPDARVGWEKSKVGLDVGYGFVYAGNDRMDHIPRFALSLFKKFEISGALHLGDLYGETELLNFILGGKFQLYKEGSGALALGGDIEMANEAAAGNSAKLYLAATYGGNFFSMPAVTTATIGWQMAEQGDFPTSQFIYGMGFSMSLFPSAFKNYVYWVTDFSNFAYAVYQPKIYAGARGAFNTGFRIHPTKGGGPFNMVIDIVGTDLLDNNERGIGLTVSGGYAFK